MYTLKKSLGQHFLKDEAISQRIADTIGSCTPELKQLLEVGPGAGALTKYLIKRADFEFKLVELDEEKVDYLLKTYPSLSGKIITGSILEVPVPFEGDFTVIGNFPYNISTQIVFRMLEWREQIECMIGMFQKEVAVRICAGPGSKDYGILSVLTQAYFQANYLFDVDEEAFNPPPKVKSGVIRLSRTGNPFGISNHRRFAALVKAAFGQRRKQLRNPLKPYFRPEVLKEDIFTKRAEQLSVADYVGLLNKMQ